MPRIRSIHPGFWTDDAVMELTVTAPLGVPLLIGLWTEADDQGIFVAKPLTLKARILPATNADVEALLDLLERLGFIRRFVVGEQRYGAIKNFRQYQRPKYPQAVHPLPDDFRKYVGLAAPTSEIDRVEDPAIPEIAPLQPPPFPRNAEISPQMEDGGWRMEDGGGKREKKEPPPPSEGGPPATRRGCRLPEDWSPDADAQAYARERGLDPMRVAEAFRDHWHAKAGKDALKLDWSAAWRTWCRNEVKFGRRPPPRETAVASASALFMAAMGRRDEPPPPHTGPIIDGECE